MRLTHVGETAVTLLTKTLTNRRSTPCAQTIASHRPLSVYRQSVKFALLLLRVNKQHTHQLRAGNQTGDVNTYSMPEMDEFPKIII